VLVADNSLAGQTIGWFPRHDFKSIIATAWNWHLNHLSQPSPAIAELRPRVRGA
jgi:UDP-glucose 4-epimerase